MGYRCRFVQPEIVRLYLAENADYIDVKKELTAGEQRHIFSGIVKAMHLGEKTTLDPDQVGKTKLVEYIVGWSFLGADEQPEPVSESAIDCLDADTYRELVELIDAHEAAVSEARKKKLAERDDIISDLRVARAMNWSYDEVLNLPAHVYEILVQMLIDDARERDG